MQKSDLEKLRTKLAIDEKKKQILSLESQMVNPSFWANNETASQKSKELADLKDLVTKFEELELFFDSGEMTKAELRFKKLEQTANFSGKYDFGNAFLYVHSGQGGVEAMDWAKMLYRMYRMFFEKKGWSFEVLEENFGEEAGIKSVSLKVIGFCAYGFLKNESGTHRLVRQSPFNADALRQTSFALVEVLPILEKHNDIELKDSELDIQFFRSSGAGGQNVNKVSTAVRIKHIPTNITVTCQSERYQAKNKDHALALLKGKLATILERDKLATLDKIKGDYKPATWGHQIRNYVLHPYKLVKDLRTNVESADPEKVLDGNLDSFIEAEIYL